MSELWWVEYGSDKHRWYGGAIVEAESRDAVAGVAKKLGIPPRDYVYPTCCLRIVGWEPDPWWRGRLLSAIDMDTMDRESTVG